MTANRVRESQAARRIALEMLRRFVPPRLDSGNNPVAGQLGVLPVYSIPMQRLIRSEFDKGWRWGWRYFWIAENGSGAILNISRGGKAGPVFSSFSFGRKAAQISALLSLANEVVEGSAIRFRPRLLSLAPLHLEAIWLNSDSNDEPEHFFSLNRNVANDAFLEIAQKRAAQLLDKN
jgi:hypothetical protein